MSGSHRRHRWFSSWWPRNRGAAQTAARMVPTNQPPAPVPSPAWWSVAPTRELPALRYAPLMTLAQAYRGNGGRWPR